MSNSDALEPHNSIASCLSVIFGKNSKGTDHLSSKGDFDPRKQ